ncbi:MAG: arginine repressor [Lachnospiraceae bacterium]|nr:arginine repressor [Lachnospiraceae bacterium]
MKTLRHEKIIELINRHEIETQEELADRLNQEGFSVTQATVSRDIRALKLTKLPVDGGKQKYAIIQNVENSLNEKYLRVLRDAFLNIDRAENIVVVKTVSGMAMAFAAALDAMKWNEVVGCIAGDDTVMCAIRTKDDALIIIDKIKKIVMQ